MTDTTTLPADWAIERALEIAGHDAMLAGVKKYLKWYPHILNIARYIETKEEPPVDPWLLQARELAAGVAKEMSLFGIADDYRDGVHDDEPEVQAIAAALRTALEQGKSA